MKRMNDENNQFLIYRSEDGRTKIDVMLEAETLWLNQKQLTELFGKAKGTNSGCGQARSYNLAGANPVPQGWPATGRYPPTLITRLIIWQLKRKPSMSSVG